MARIAYITSRYPAISHTFVLREVAALRARGIEVDTFSVRATDPAQLLSEADRAEAASTTVIVPARPAELAGAHRRALARPAAYAGALRRALDHGAGGPKSSLWRLFYLAEAGVLLDHCRERGIRHVHAHFANVGADVAMLASAMSGGEVGWSYTMHGPTEFADVAHFRLAEKTEEAGFVVCISDYCRSQLMKLVGPEHWDKLEIVHCGIDPARFAPPAVPRRPGPLRVLCVGRLVPDKGQALLVDAMRLLAERSLDAELILVGDGPDRARLAESVARSGLGGRVTLAGAIGQDRVRDFYADADVFCLPSFAEGVPVVLMEAMAMGLPVVTTNITGVPELVEDGVSGHLVRPARPDQLADAVAGLAADPSLRRRMGEAGRRKVIEEFSTDVVGDRLAAVLAARGALEPAA
ncbi:MAG: glycosyltransferase [Thermoleophilia bacterium]